MKPIVVDLTGLGAQFGLTSENIDMLTEMCVKSVTAAVFANWEALAKKELSSTASQYIGGLHEVNKGRFANQIVLTGVLPNMLEKGASAFDMKEGFKRSDKVKYTLPVYNSNGMKVKDGGDWFLTIPFRIGTPGTLGQAGFSSEMPNEVYNLMRKRGSGVALKANEIPSPYDVPKSREAIMNEKGQTLYKEYQHKSSIYEGVTKRTAQYGKTTQNTYGSFRRAGENSDAMSWMHKGLNAKWLSKKAVEETDVETIVENEVINFLEAIL